MKLALALLGAALSLVSATGARAQAQPAPVWYPPPPGYPVTFVATDPKLQMDFSIDKTSAPFVRCVGSCDLWLAPREYFITVPETEQTLAGRRKLEIEWPARATVEPRTKSGKQGGLIMGITGIVLVLAGSVAFVVASDTEGGDPDAGNAGVGLGLLGVLGGAILTPLGWVKFARSAPSVELSPRP